MIITKTDEILLEDEVLYSTTCTDRVAIDVFGVGNTDARLVFLTHVYVNHVVSRASRQICFIFASDHKQNILLQSAVTKGSVLLGERELLLGFWFNLSRASFKSSSSFEASFSGDGVNDVDDSEGGDDFEREPFASAFKVKDGSFDFVLVNNHLNPDLVALELPVLIEVFQDAAQRFSEPDIIVLGDFNADDNYYSEDRYQEIFPPDQYLWLIPNTTDTMVLTDNIYDRIIATPSLSEDNTGEHGVTQLAEFYNF